MVTGVGLTGPSTCAAIRCAIDNFSDTRFMDKGGEWIVGSQVPLDQPWRGLERLRHLAVAAIRECLRNVTAPPGSIPLLFCVAERSRPGRVEGVETQLLKQIVSELGMSFHSRSVVIPQGRVAAAVALGLAERLIREEGVQLCLIVGVDSLLVGPTLATYEERERLLTSRNSNGFIPGEAGAAILVGPERGQGGPELVCVGIGVGREKATIEADAPLRAEGLSQALLMALENSGLTFDDVHFRLTDMNGEQYRFREAALALSRTVRKVKPAFELWHPADCVGEIGAAIGPCILGVALSAMRKGYAPGPGVLCHFSSDGEERVALVLAARRATV
jgi:3-oxoacyl-[acyl-carrier-protein] synthase I